MKIKDAFTEVRTGVNVNKLVRQGNYAEEVYTFHKDAIQGCKLIESRFIKKIVDSEINDKYYMKPRDIIISLKKPYKVGTLPYDKKDKILIPNNFAILRGIDRDKYGFIFLSNYLDKIGIDKFLETRTTTGDLTISEIENIELPDIPKDEQTKIRTLLDSINERSIIYNTILDNDAKIVEYVLKEVIGENNV